MVGGTMPSRRAITQATASTAPAAPSMCPVMDLVELTMQARAASSPRASLMALVSQASLRGVLVPWALMYSFWGAEQPPASW